MTHYDPNRSLGFLLHDVSRLLRRNFNRRAEKLGLTQAQWQTLAHIARCEGIRQVQIADLLEVQPITLSRLVDKLAAAGWVERRPDPQDRRAVQLYLTAKAQPLLEDIRALATESRAEAFVGFTDAERERLIDSLLALKCNLQKADQDACAAEVSSHG